MEAAAGRSDHGRGELERRMALAEAVNRIAASIGRCLDMRRLIAEVVSSAKALVGADGATIFLVDEDGSLYCDSVDGGAEGAVSGLRLEPGEGVVGWVAERRRSLLVPDVALDARFARRVDELTGYRTRSVAAAPLLVAGDLVGVLEVVNGREGRPFLPVDLESLRALAPHVAVAVSNAKLTERLARKAEDLESELEQRIGQVLFAKREWVATVDSFLDPIMLVDPDRRVRRANTEVARRAGISIAEVPERKCHEVAFGAAEPCDGCPLPRALEGSAATAEIRVGKELHHASHFPVRDEERGTHAVACCYRDVTASRAMEVRLKDAERMASIGRLAAGIAHEINNPIAFMSSNLRTLRGYFEDLVDKASRPPSVPDGGRGTMPEEVAELAEDGMAMLEECRVGAGRISNIVRQLGSFAHERFSAEERFFPSHCVGRAVRQLEREFSGAVIEARDESEGVVRGFPASFDQAIAAVIRNALQASPGYARATVRDREDVVEIAVEDHGPGIDESIRARVFEPFFTTRAVGSGMGLGLSVVYASMERHGGAVTIEDSPLGGARIVMSLPRIDAGEG